jgi:hypothetical protein
MLEFKKKPVWKPGDYKKILEETLKLTEKKIEFDKVNFMKKLSHKKQASKYGIGYDMHDMHRMIGGSMKTLVMVELEKNNK